MGQDKFQNIASRIITFRDARDWKQFHNPKDLAISLMLESSEVLEHFQWKNEKEINEHVKNNKDEIAEELADVLNYLIILANDLDIDILSAEEEKVKKNEKKYPTEKAKGNHKKYTELENL